LIFVFGRELERETDEADVNEEDERVFLPNENDGEGDALVNAREAIV